jgi:hypothetical protein
MSFCSTHVQKPESSPIVHSGGKSDASCVRLGVMFDPSGPPGGDPSPSVPGRPAPLHATMAATPTAPRQARSEDVRTMNLATNNLPTLRVLALAGARERRDA